MKSFYDGESVPSLSIYSRQTSNWAGLPDLSNKSAYMESTYVKTSMPLVQQVRPLHKLSNSLIMRNREIESEKQRQLREAQKIFLLKNRNILEEQMKVNKDSLQEEN